MTIGVLALQGDFALHERALERIGRTSAEVRTPAELERVEGLIIPGGESTTLLKLMAASEFVPALKRFHAAGRPIFGTCAGLLVLAREVLNPVQFSLGFIDVTAERNAYGRQNESFEARGTVNLGRRPRPIEMVFIRAPRILRLGPTVTALAWHGSECVMAREGLVLVAAFHPELTDDSAFHRYFARMVSRKSDRSGVRARATEGDSLR